MKEKNKSVIPELMRNDPAKWYGPFYINKNDKRIMVPKIDPSLGYTFNMGSPYALLILVLIVALIIISYLLF